MSPGERLVLAICLAEIHHRGYVALDGVPERPVAYLGARERVIADAVKLGAEPARDLATAFLYLLRVDRLVTAHERGIALVAPPSHRRVH
jgi:hypothetical protein